MQRNSWVIKIYSKVYDLTYFLPFPHSVPLLFTETSHHIYNPHTEARGQVNLKDLIVEHCSAGENSADGKSSKSLDCILQHKACKLERHKSKMRKAKVCISCTYSTAVPLQTQTTAPAASQKPGQQHHCVKPTHCLHAGSQTQRLTTAGWGPQGVKLLILLSCPQGAAIDTACGLVKISSVRNLT